MKPHKPHRQSQFLTKVVERSHKKGIGTHKNRQTIYETQLDEIDKEAERAGLAIRQHKGFIPSRLHTYEERVY